MDRVNEQSREQANIVRFGTIAEVDAAAARCRVKSGDMVSDLIPWVALCAGHTIAWSAPSVGEQVMLVCPEGDTAGGVALRGLYCNDFAAPASNPAVTLIQFKDGATLQYDSDAHALTAVLPSGGKVDITASGGTTINGPLTVNGDVTVAGDADLTGTVTATTDVVGGGKSLKSHIHLGVQTGGGTSGPPQ